MLHFVLKNFRVFKTLDVLNTMDFLRNDAFPAQGSKNEVKTGYVFTV